MIDQGQNDVGIGRQRGGVLDHVENDGAYCGEQLIIGEDTGWIVSMIEQETRVRQL